MVLLPVEGLTLLSLHTLLSVHKQAGNAILDSYRDRLCRQH